ncbi:hypothetical protein Adt_15228 [Abeliophyllum distichum]|uniref:Uncharacterized protein n=1 Tax=Abeliophyllum distichum TaxID=126358 RepID=A0ABD1U1V4_9LAMI
MEVRGIQPNEEEGGAAYLAGLIESVSFAPIIDDNSNFVDPPVKMRKNFNAANVSNLGPIRDCKKSENLKSKKKSKIAADKRLRQDRIISQQIDLEYDIRTIQCGVDEKIDEFFEEMRAKFLGKSSPEVSRSQLVVYND